MTTDLEESTKSKPRHPKKVDPATPQLNYREISWLPRINVAEWLEHTSKMILFEWFPLIYFTIACMLAPRDHIGCSKFAVEKTQEIIMYVFGPILVMRFIGSVWMNTPGLIVYQIVLIYGWLIVSLLYWDVNTFEGMIHLDRHCFRPLKVSMLNLVTMLIFYVFVLSPYITIILMLPFYVWEVFKEANRQRQKKLLKHYLIKSMPSIAFNKKIFQSESGIGSANMMDECVICLETFAEGEDYVTPLACDKRHIYHSNCIEEWLQSENFCPMCKKVQTPNMMRSFRESFDTEYTELVAEYNHKEEGGDQHYHVAT